MRISGIAVDGPLRGQMLTKEVNPLYRSHTFEVLSKMPPPVVGSRRYSEGELLDMARLPFESVVYCWHEIGHSEAVLGERLRDGKMVTVGVDRYRFFWSVSSDVNWLDAWDFLVDMLSKNNKEG